MTDNDGGINNQAGSSIVACAMAVAYSGKCQVRPPTDHFEKLFEDICSNDVYPIMHKLRDRGMEVDEVPDEGNTMPFPGEEAVMMIYDGRPPPGMCCVSYPSLGTPARCDWGRRNMGMYGHEFSHTFTYVEI
jgi:hypothetical protein